jgi:hypothetical protein
VAAKVGSLSHRALQSWAHLPAIGRSPLMASVRAASAALALMRSAWVRGRVRSDEAVPEISLDCSRRR